jgi:murein DD-endopeptidase MepM/ murein hydrolase activator NlpD
MSGSRKGRPAPAGTCESAWRAGSGWGHQSHQSTAELDADTRQIHPGRLHIWRVRNSAILAAAIIAILSGCRTERIEVAGGAAADIHLPTESVIIDRLVPPHATLDGLLHGIQIGGEMARVVIARARTAFDVRALRAGQRYRIVRSASGLFRSFEYIIDRDRYLRVTGLDRGEPGAITAEIREYPKRTVTGTISRSIDSAHPSLVAAVEDAGEQIDLALQIAEVFSGQVDFNLDLRAGDHFEALFEKHVRDGQFAGYGPIRAAILVNADRHLQAFRVVQNDGSAAYFDENGDSVRQFFLPSPLPFTPRVTSGFSVRRLHPVHGVERPHLGVDYAAPIGTPVLAVASGVVVSAGLSGASGRLIRLRHSNGYESYYLHLSAIGSRIRPGVRVAQGDVIGRVGRSGVVTGPHLDYRLSKGGVFVNPLVEVRALSPVETIGPESRRAFEATRIAAMSELAQWEAASTLSHRRTDDEGAAIDSARGRRLGRAPATELATTQ